MCQQFTLCVALCPYVSLTQFGECVATRIHCSIPCREIFFKSGARHLAAYLTQTLTLPLLTKGVGSCQPLP